MTNNRFLEYPSEFHITHLARERIDAILIELDQTEANLLAFLWRRQMAEVTEKMEADPEGYDMPGGGAFVSLWPSVNLCVVDSIIDGKRRTSIMTMPEGDFAVWRLKERLERGGHSVLFKKESDDDLSL